MVQFGELGHVHDPDYAASIHTGTLNSLEHGRRSGDSARLDHKMSGCEFSHDLLNRADQVRFERAADTPARQLDRFDSPGGKDLAVDPGCTEIVNQHNRLLAQPLKTVLYEGRLARPQKTAHNRCSH